FHLVINTTSHLPQKLTPFPTRRSSDLDTVGAMIAGANESSTTQLIEQVASNHEGKYTVVGSKRQLSRDMAAFINGVSSVAIEMDEGNQWSKGHPAAHVVPALLTVVEEDGTYNGKQFLLHLV